MGNSIHKEAYRSKEHKVVQIMRIDDGKILEFRNQTLVKDVLATYPNSYVGFFNGATQPLPCHYKLKFGKIYYLLACPNQQVDPRMVQVENGGGGGDNNGGTTMRKRIKVVITKQQLQHLLDKSSVGFQETLVFGAKQSNLVLIQDDHHISSSSSSPYLPKLATIYEGCDFVC